MEGVVGFEFVSPGSTCEEVVAQILQHFLGRPWGRLFLRRSDGLRYSVAGERLRVPEFDLVQFAGAF